MKSLLIYIQRLICSSVVCMYTPQVKFTIPPGCKHHLHFSFLLKYPVPKSFSWGLN